MNHKERLKDIAIHWGEGFLVFLILTCFVAFFNIAAWISVSLLFGLMYGSMKSGLKKVGNFIKSNK